MSLFSAIEELKSLYGSCPEVPCFQCGECCVAPHMTFVEFVLLLETLFESQSKEELAALVATPPQLSGKHEGNLVCSLQGGQLCHAREGRSLSCRVEGLRALDELFEREVSICPHMDRKFKVEITPPEIEVFIEKLTTLNEEFYRSYTPPYYLDGLNLDCWFSIVLGEALPQEPFATLRRLVWEKFDLTAFETAFIERSHIKDKLELVDEMYRQLEGGDKEGAGKLLDRIVADFPYAEGFFYFQAQIMLQELGDV